MANLILYYSRKGENYWAGGVKDIPKGNTERIAEFIQQTVGGDLFEVEAVKDYPADYYECIDEAQAELRAGSRPEVKAMPDVSAYDTIFVGYPNWWGTMPMCLFTVIESLDLSGKRISTSNESSGSASQDDTTITVAAVPTPHAEVLRDVVAPLLEKEGYTLEVEEFNDYVLPNTATEQGDVDANYFQHEPYLIDFNQQNNTHLVKVASVHYEPFGLYAGKTASLDELPDGATVAVPNDSTNEARALLLLEQEGLIEVDDNAGITATVLDITSNPKNLQFEELEAAQVPRALSDVDIAAINSNYAIEANLNPERDALAIEDPNGDAAQTYANILVVKEGNENLPKIQALAQALNTDEVRQYLIDNFSGAVLPVF